MFYGNFYEVFFCSDRRVYQSSSSQIMVLKYDKLLMAQKNK